MSRTLLTELVAAEGRVEELEAEVERLNRGAWAQAAEETGRPVSCVRAEAEQAVLDSMGRAGHSTLLSYQQTPGWLGDACRAELARRGLA